MCFLQLLLNGIDVRATFLKVLSIYTSVLLAVGMKLLM